MLIYSSELSVLMTQDSREIERRDNFFAVPVMDGEEVSVGVNGKIVTQFIVPYTAKLKCYLASDRKAILYKD